MALSIADQAMVDYVGTPGTFPPGIYSLSDYSNLAGTVFSVTGSVSDMENSFFKVILHDFPSPPNQIPLEVLSTLSRSDKYQLLRKSVVHPEYNRKITSYTDLLRMYNVTLS